MKLVGILILAAGLILGAFALNMDVSVYVPAQDFGYGIRTHEMNVANADKMAQRQNLLIFSGVLAVVGAILTGFASMQPKPPPLSAAERSELLAFLDEKPEAQVPAEPSAVSICPKCRSMGSADAQECFRCGTPLSSTA